MEYCWQVSAASIFADAEKRGADVSGSVSSRIMNTPARQVIASDLTMPGRLAMLVINCSTFLLSLLFLSLLLIPCDIWWHRAIYATLALYLAPPLIARLIRRFFTLREGVLAPGSRNFLVWWTLFNLQVIFCRIPLLEELLRIVPGLYSAWLRLWGARIGRFTYWAPGTTILDRSFVAIGNDVVLGAGVRINPHVMMLNSAGEKEVILATVTIGDKALIGGYSLLTAGTEIAPCESVRAYFIAPPYSRWQNGKRTKESMSGSESL